MKAPQPICLGVRDMLWDGGRERKRRTGYDVVSVRHCRVAGEIRSWGETVERVAWSSCDGCDEREGGDESWCVHFSLFLPFLLISLP